MTVDGGAGILELALGLVGLVLVDALEHGLGSTLDEVLGLLEAEAGELADDLDDGDLVVAEALEDDVERGLLLGLGGSLGGATGGSDGDRSGGGDAEDLLHHLDELGQLQRRLDLDSLEDLFVA